MVATGEDAAEAEDDDQEEGSAQGEAEGRSRCVHARWREILALHYAHLLLLLLCFRVALVSLRKEPKFTRIWREKKRKMSVLEGRSEVCVGIYRLYWECSTEGFGDRRHSQRWALPKAALCFSTQEDLVHVCYIYILRIFIKIGIKNICTCFDVTSVVLMYLSSILNSLKYKYLKTCYSKIPWQDNKFVSHNNFVQFKSTFFTL